jgi:hypothetical protein
VRCLCTIPIDSGMLDTLFEREVSEFGAEVMVLRSIKPSLITSEDSIVQRIEKTDLILLTQARQWPATKIIPACFSSKNK